MRILLFLLFAVFVFANEPKTCYSVALLSIPPSPQRLELLHFIHYPSPECKVLQIGEYLTVRCGCYADIKQAKALYGKIKAFPLAKDPLVMPTYRFRFEEPRKKKPDKILKAPANKCSNALSNAAKQHTSSATAVVEESFSVPYRQKSGSFLDELPVDFTFLARSVSGKRDIYRYDRYLFALAESQYEGDDYTLRGGVAWQMRGSDKEFLLNHLYGEYFGDAFTFKIGKMVQKVGVLDYFSVLDTQNPLREEYFDDSQLEIKRIPLWMSVLEYYPSDTMKVVGIVEPFDAKYQNYTGVYVGYILNQFIPSLYHDFFTQDLLGREVFYPVYNDALVPYLSDAVQSQTQSSGVHFDKLSYSAVFEYGDGDTKLGVLYYNRYSEVPLIKVNQHLLDALEAFYEGEDASEYLQEYIASGEIAPLNGVESFRYEQFGLYGESSIDSYGIRAEMGYRDKVPLVNGYGDLYSAGFGIDRFDEDIYNAIEVQSIYLPAYGELSSIAMWRAKLAKRVLWRFEWYFENRVLWTHLSSMNEYSLFPSLTFHYEGFDLSIQGLLSKNNSQTNAFSLLLRGRF